MTYEILLALALFAFSTVFTPGPNNLMLMSSGANFGLRRSIPHMTGVAYGFPFMIILVGLGAMQLFDAWPPSYLVLKIFSVAYILWLAWKIAHSAPPADAPSDAKPLSFLQAAGFQWLNPKAWSMALGAITLYATSRDLSAVLWVAGTYAVIGTGSATTWTVLGTGVRKLLARPERLRLFNWTMAALLVVSMMPVLLGG
ncbi:LysE family translocator [Tropicibacter sp. R15_0]|uniref:LysE family translocator n=1 Tax=Tropicibacter sp. R15_0 TaxID=2821101 RepID=UPI001ADA9313|nr:LysE family translocator [Tropicibacter sp. R15_0]MBO9466975.1 LysE family translocator [Tropicibacter sp. R15_0]